MCPEPLLELVQWTSNVDVTIIQGDERQRLMTIRSVWWEYYTELLMCVRRECSFRPLTHIIWLIVSAKFINYFHPNVPANQTSW